MKIISYNLNGIRAAMNKNLTAWLKEQNADVVCFQELKAQEDQIDKKQFEELGYHLYWHPAQKKGYSGVAILSRTKPDNVVYGCGHANYDEEGRVLRADFGDMSVISLYLPSGTSGEERQGFKMEFCTFFLGYIQKLLNERPNLVINGDFNICHENIDIHNPKGNARNSGFLPEEREWLTQFLGIGFADSFRTKYPEKVLYSWWSQRFNARANNKGWRIDYNMVSNPLKSHIIDAGIHNDAMHSDHCPVSVEIDSSI